MNVIKIVSHPEYDRQSSANDISILTLDKDVSFSDSVHPICIPNDENYAKDTATVTGWSKFFCTI